MRSAQEVGREILVALEAMRPFLEHASARERLSVDLTSLGEAFGATGSAASTSGRAGRCASLRLGSRQAPPRPPPACGAGGLMHSPPKPFTGGVSGTGGRTPAHR